MRVALALALVSCAVAFAGCRELRAPFDPNEANDEGWIDVRITPRRSDGGSAGDWDLRFETVVTPGQPFHSGELERMPDGTHRGRLLRGRLYDFVLQLRHANGWVRPMLRGQRVDRSAMTLDFEVRAVPIEILLPEEQRARVSHVELSVYPVDPATGRRSSPHAHTARIEGSLSGSMLVGGEAHYDVFLRLRSDRESWSLHRELESVFVLGDAGFAIAAAFDTVSLELMLGGELIRGAEVGIQFDELNGADFASNRTVWAEGQAINVPGRVGPTLVRISSAYLSEQFFARGRVLDIGEDRRAQIDLGAHRIRLRVQSADGTPWAGASIRLEQNDESEEIRTDVGGERLFYVAAGELRARASVDVGGVIWSSVWVDTIAGDTDILLVVEPPTP